MITMIIDQSNHRLNFPSKGYNHRPMYCTEKKDPEILTTQLKTAKTGIN